MDKALLQAIAKVSKLKDAYKLQFPVRVANATHYFLDFTNTVHYNTWLEQRKKTNA